MLSDDGSDDALALVERIEVAPGSLKLKLDAAALADRLELNPAPIEVAALVASRPELDRTLLRNFAKAHAWFERIKAGETFAEIAAAGGTSKCRIQQMISLAFLAPDIVRDVIEGRQPAGFTPSGARSGSCRRTGSSNARSSRRSDPPDAPSLSNLPPLNGHAQTSRPPRLV